MALLIPCLLFTMSDTCTRLPTVGTRSAGFRPRCAKELRQDVFAADLDQEAERGSIGYDQRHQASKPLACS